MSTLKLDDSLVIFDDGTPTNNPYLRIPDWTKHLTLDVSNPLAAKYVIAPSASLTVFSGTDTTSIDNTTQFNVTLSPLSSSIYRLTWNGTGTAPALRTDRALNLSGYTITIAVNNNATATFTCSAGVQNFGSVQVGDTLFVPGASTGDTANVFNVNNEGAWQVIAATTTVLTVTRLAGQAFSGVSETATLTSSPQLLAFSASGVQVGDKVEISAGFSPVTWGTYVVSQVTAKWFEFVSSNSLPLESNILPTSTGLAFYNKAKKFVYLETDQDAAIRLNGDTGNNVRLSPVVAADPNNTALFKKLGPTWSLVVVNRSPVYPLNLVVISAE